MRAQYSWVLQSHKVSSISDQKQKIFITRTFFVNKQLTLFFNYLKTNPFNFAQNFRKCSFNLAGSESGEKSRCAQLFVYISQLFVYKMSTVCLLNVSCLLTFFVCLQIPSENGMYWYLCYFTFRLLRLKKQKESPSAALSFFLLPANISSFFAVSSTTSSSHFLQMIGRSFS